MWNWIEKLLGKSSQPVRKRVPMEIPFEQIDTGMGRAKEEPVEKLIEQELKDS